MNEPVEYVVQATTGFSLASVRRLSTDHLFLVPPREIEPRFSEATTWELLAVTLRAFQPRYEKTST